MPGMPSNSSPVLARLGWSVSPRKLDKGSLPGPELPGTGGSGGRVSFGKLKEATYPYIALCPYRPHMGLRLQQIKGRKEGRAPRGPFAVDFNQHQLNPT